MKNEYTCRKCDGRVVLPIFTIVFTFVNKTLCLVCFSPPRNTHDYLGGQYLNVWVSRQPGSHRSLEGWYEKAQWVTAKSDEYTNHYGLYIRLQTNTFTFIINNWTFNMYLSFIAVKASPFANHTFCKNNFRFWYLNTCIRWFVEI